MISPARRAAFDVLLAVHSQRQHLAGALAATRDPLNDARDRALATDIAVGTERWRGRLDHQIDQVSTKPVHRLDPEIAVILRMSAYQLEWLARVPARAVVNDAVNLAGVVGKRSAAGLVNAVLRKLATRSPPLPPPPAAEQGSAQWRNQALAYLSVTHSHPPWLVDRWIERYGYDAALAWVTFNNTPPSVTLWRAPARSAHTLQGLIGTPTSWVPDGLVLEDHQQVGAALASGDVYAQDEASAVVAMAAAAVAASPMLDACAAPGGKTLALDAVLPSDIRLIAADMRPARVALLKATLNRLGHRTVPVLRADARALPFRTSLGSVLIDAPCTGLGTLRREPDVKWRRSEADLATYAHLQQGLIDEALRAAGPDARVVYATCSSEPEENEALISSGAAAHRWRIVPWSRRGLPSRATQLVAPEGWIRTMPHVHGLDAFFAVVLTSADARAGQAPE